MVQNVVAIATAALNAAIVGFAGFLLAHRVTPIRVIPGVFEFTGSLRIASQLEPPFARQCSNSALRESSREAALCIRDASLAQPLVRTTIALNASADIFR